MWFSRVWIVLIAAFVAILLGAALVAPKPSSRDLGNLHGNRLDLVQHNAELRLQLMTRELIDSTWAFAQDASLVDVLEQASARQKSFLELRQRAETAMRALLSRYGETPQKPTLFIAVDYRGKQIARLGPGEKKFKAGRDGLGGYPLVGAALKGLLRDDTWSYDGQLYLMAGAPVISRARNRYTGALLMGIKISDKFAARFKKQLIPDAPHLPRSEVAFFLRGQILSSTIQSAAFSKLPQRFTKQRSALLKQGRSAAFRIGSGEQSYFAVMAPLAGSALSHDAFYVIATRAPKAPTLLGVIGKLDAKKDLTATLWLLLGGVFLVLLIIGIVLTRQEHSSPIRRLELALQKVLKGDVTRLDEFKHGGGLRPTAKLINELIDKGAKRGAGAASAAAGRAGGETIDRILDNTVMDTRIDDVALDGGMPPLADGPPSIGLMQSAGVETGGHHIDRIPAPADGVTPLVGLDAEEAPTELAAPPPFSLDQPMPAASEEALPALTPMELPGATGDFPMASSPIELPPAGPVLDVQVTSQDGLPHASDVVALPSDLSSPEQGADPQAEYFHQIYEEFPAVIPCFHWFAAYAANI
jgi:hypothetical protein